MEAAEVYGIERGGEYQIREEFVSRNIQKITRVT